MSRITVKDLKDFMSADILGKRFNLPSGENVPTLTLSRAYGRCVIEITGEHGRGYGRLCCGSARECYDYLTDYTRRTSISTAIWHIAITLIEGDGQLFATTTGTPVSVTRIVGAEAHRYAYSVKVGTNPPVVCANAAHAAAYIGYALTWCI